MGLFSWFRRRKEDPPPIPTPEPETTAHVGWQGREVRINPTAPETLSRNTARIATLRLALQHEKRPEKRASLDAELRRRLRFQPREE